MDSKIAREEQDRKFVKIMQAFALIREAKMLEHLSNADLIKNLLFADVKGFLHYYYEGKQMMFVGCAYMLPKFKGSTAHIMPLKSEGDILYIPWVISRVKDKTIPKKVLSDYLKEHPNTKQIVFYKGDSPTPTIMNRKGDESGRQEQEAVATKHSDVSARP